MKLNAVAVASTDLPTTVRFYELLGFEFPELMPGDRHIEAVSKQGSARLMIDAASLVEEMLGHQPRPANHSNFALQYASADKIDQVVESIKSANFEVVKSPWDAKWGQRYAVVKDPDGYYVDLYAPLAAI